MYFFLPCQFGALVRCKAVLVRIIVGAKPYFVSHSLLPPRVLRRWAVPGTSAERLLRLRLRRPRGRGVRRETAWANRVRVRLTWLKLWGIYGNRMLLIFWKDLIKSDSLLPCQKALPKK